ncbi:MAG: 2'-5' RNA ligase family protein [Bryobacteraceae bacterium]|nr:2'-5' RNA ligase family protein [Bryobacteraceae bacterium]
MCEPPGDPINQFAVVCYIPDYLGDFITRLRCELVSGCTARSHVTVLPPRPLTASPDLAASELIERSVQYFAFPLEVSRLRIFVESSVIFADVSRGRDELFEMHDTLNSGTFFFDEPHDYHPHITLAQGIDPVTVKEVYEMAVRRWNELAPRPPIMIENMTFVRNTTNNRWIDLAQCELRGTMVTLP